jgi:murein DD-endopeptidase MepM/ murein hydrolase activator NlpD
MLLVVMDDGTIYTTYSATGSDWVVTANAGKKDPVVDPKPDPGDGGGTPDPTPGDWQWPFQYSRYVFQTGPYASLAQFGYRIHPITGVKKLHMGLDFGAGGIAGMAIPAASGGTVVEANYNGAMGNHVIIDHAGGFRTRYFHMVATPDVRAGQTVTKGQKLGNVGSTGLSTGPHLHWETFEGGQVVDPRGFMKRRGAPES